MSSLVWNGVCLDKEQTAIANTAIGGTSSESRNIVSLRELHNTSGGYYICVRTNLGGRGRFFFI